VIILPLDQPN